MKNNAAPPNVPSRESFMISSRRAGGASTMSPSPQSATPSRCSPPGHGDPDKAADDAAQGGGQELCRKAEREGYEHADDVPDHGNQTATPGTWAAAARNRWAGG